MLEQMVLRWEMFCEVIGSVAFAWFPDQVELELLYPAFYPPVLHVESFREFLAEVSGEDDFCSGIVGRYAVSFGCLWVVEFGQCGDDGYCLMAADEDTACLCFGCGGNDVFRVLKMTWMAPFS